VRNKPPVYEEMRKALYAIIDKTGAPVSDKLRKELGDNYSLQAIDTYFKEASK